MSILTEQLPEAVLIDGKEYPINIDFREQLKSLRLLKAKNLQALKKMK